MRTSEAVSGELRERGFAVGRQASPDRVVCLLSRLGKVLRISEVRCNPAIGSYLASAGPVPPHTDHPDARYITWICRENDPWGGENLLVDGHAIVDRLPASLRRSLSAARLKCPEHGSASNRGFDFVQLQAKPVWQAQQRALFFAPWLPRSAHDMESLGQFAHLVDEAPRSKVRLEAGDVLVVDNHRILHARGALRQGSRRWLTRYWIKAANP